MSEYHKSKFHECPSPSTVSGNLTASWSHTTKKCLLLQDFQVFLSNRKQRRMDKGFASTVYSAICVVQQSGDSAGHLGDGDGERRQGGEVQKQL